MCAPKLWNSLPLDLSKSPSLTGFKKELKTYLFRQFLESGSLFSLTYDFKTCYIMIVNQIDFMLVICKLFHFPPFYIVKRLEFRI